jgi:hypothetical protein
MRLRSPSLIWSAWAASRRRLWCDCCSLAWLSRNSRVMPLAILMARRRDEVSAWNSAYISIVPPKPAKHAIHGQYSSKPVYMFCLSVLKVALHWRPLKSIGSVVL